MVPRDEQRARADEAALAVELHVEACPVCVRNDATRRPEADDLAERCATFEALRRVARRHRTACQDAR